MTSPDPAELRPLVMIVEPDQLVRELLQDGLEAEGFAWVSAPGDAEALRLLEQLPRALHGLVVPIQGDRLTGWFLAQLARRFSPSTVVVYTAEAGFEAPIGRHGREARILVKPFRLDQLLDALRRPAPAPARRDDATA